MQCLFAADRDLVETHDYLDACSPELYRFLQIAANIADDRVHRVQLCGLLPQLQGVLPVLAGMGFRNFSVAPVMVPYLAQTARSVILSEAETLAQQVCNAEDNQAVRSLLESTGDRSMPG
jgi:phosphotransferase system enzyme I (PtsI)